MAQGPGRHDAATTPPSSFTGVVKRSSTAFERSVDVLHRSSLNFRADSRDFGEFFPARLDGNARRYFYFIVFIDL